MLVSLLPIHIAAKANTIESRPVVLSVFDGEMTIPDDFVLYKKQTNNVKTYYREVKGSKKHAASEDIINYKKIDNNEFGTYQGNSLKKIEEKIENGFLIEKWTPNEGISFSGKYYVVIISRGNEQLWVRSMNLLLWREVFNSYKANPPNSRSGLSEV